VLLLELVLVLAPPKAGCCDVDVAPGIVCLMESGVCLVER